MRLIIDTDAGIDDAEALVMALTHPDVTVEAITTLTGNIHIDLVNKNVSTILQVTGKQIPVYAGATLPLVQPWKAEAVPYHLNDGMGDWDERPPCTVKLEAEHAANALVRLANENPGELTLVAIGPMTNVALAIRLDPTFPEKIKKFVFMGGTLAAHGNTPIVTAEYNIYTDPEAAFMTLQAFKHATMLSWETTLYNPLTWDQYDALCAGDSPLKTFFRGITGKIVKRTRQENNYGGYLLPDPLAMAAALQPDLILAQETRHVTVELHGQYTRGQTVINYTLWENTGTPNVAVITKMDMDGVFAQYQRMLG